MGRCEEEGCRGILYFCLSPLQNMSAARIMIKRQRRFLTPKKACRHFCIVVRRPQSGQLLTIEAIVDASQWSPIKISESSLAAEQRKFGRSFGAARHRLCGCIMMRAADLCRNEVERGKNLKCLYRPSRRIGPILVWLGFSKVNPWASRVGFKTASKVHPQAPHLHLGL